MLLYCAHAGGAVVLCTLMVLLFRFAPAWCRYCTVLILSLCTLMALPVRGTPVWYCYCTHVMCCSCAVHPLGAATALRTCLMLLYS